MPLTPEEEKQFRDQIRADLEQRLHRTRESRERVRGDRQRNMEERMRQQIRDEEEERFYAEKGLVRHQNRYGEVEWITADEAEQRRSRRRTGKKRPSKRKERQRRFIYQWLTIAAMIIFAGTVFMYLLRYNPISKSNRMGAIAIVTDVPGAQVFIDGVEKNQFVTPDTMGSIAPGVHFVSVYREGYSVWPPMQRITVAPGKTISVSFQLKASARLGKLSVTANQGGYQLYVDGLAIPQNGAQIEIPAGFRVISAVKPGYIATPNHHRVLVKEDEVTELQFTFQEDKNVGYLHISSNRSSAYVFLDNRLSGMKANAGRFPVSAGIYEVRVCENGYQSLPDTKLLQIMPGEEHELVFNLYREADSDTLKLFSDVPGANIIVDGKWLPFVTPAMDLQMTPGSHFINLMRDGRLYAENDVYIDFNQLSEKQLHFRF